MVSEKSSEALARVYAAETEEALGSAYDDWAGEYDRETLSAGYCLPFAVLAFVARHVPADAGPVLDVGCGTGLSGPLLAALGFRDIHGLDMSPSMLAVAAHRDVYAKLTQARLGAPLPFEDNSFAALFSTGVFTEGHAPASCLDELVRIVAPGGIAVLTVRDSVLERGGFAQAFDRLTETGRWRALEQSPLFRAFAIDEPHVLVRAFTFRKI